ncbi:MAG: glycoside hydrolase family 31 protein [Actinomycetaceae bacterium]|nr:glycoside hydrolase family 31 protein [Actinomycetaceae bacterium]
MRICTRAESIEPTGNGYVIKTDAVPIRILALTADIIRIRAGFDGDFREESYSLVTTAWEDRLDGLFQKERKRIDASTLRLIDEDGGWSLQGEKLRVQVRKAPFQIKVYDAEGDCLHADLVDLSYREDSNKRRIHTSEISVDDYFYGFGEKTGHLNKAGSFMSMAPADAMGYDPIKTDSLYKHIPFYIKLSGRTKKAVGYFYHNTYECDFNMGRAKSNYWPPHSHYRVDGGDIDLFLIAGPKVRDVVERYTDLTGKSVMLPKSALGYLGSSMYYPELPKDCDKAITEFIDTTRDYEIPVDGFHLSSGYTQQETESGLKRCVFTWNDERFPDPEGFFKAMEERGIVVSPNVKPGILLVHPRMDEFKDEGIFIKESGSEKPQTGTWWGGKGHFVDFTNPHARSYWQEALTKNVLEKGTWSVWNDNCEYESVVDKDAVCYFDGTGGTVGQLKSVMSNLMCMTTRTAIENVFDNQRPYVVCRSGHAGIQRYAQTWAGDNYTSWESLKYNIATILGMSLSGVANQGCDVCGFSGPAPEGELMVRWIQNGIFQPRFSIHSTNTDNTVTEPWMYTQVTDIIREAMQLRYRLFPYLYSLMYRASQSGLPIMEPMVSAFQHDENVYEEGVDFMLGDALLVANVVEKGATTRKVYLPEGEVFYDLQTRERFEGGQAVCIPVDLGSIPMFIRSGQILVLADNELTNLATQAVTDLRVVCAPDKDGSFTLYEDDGMTFDYLEGMYLQTQITVTAGEKVTFSVTHAGKFESAVESITLDVIHREKAPYWVKVDDVELHHYLDRRRFDAAQSGWYYSQTLRSVQVKYPNPKKDHEVCVSFEVFDLIGI